jgi:hypothetical protein
MDIDLDQIPGAIEVRLGLPRLDWDSVWTWTEEHVDDVHREEAWSVLVRQWLARLRDALRRRSNYEVYESERFILLSSADSNTSERLLFWCESARRKTRGALPRLGADDYKWVILAFADIDTYYNYIADLYPEEGEFGGTGGMCFQGHGQVVLFADPKLDLERTISHEIVHSQLADLPLPLWLNEGVTHVLEDMIVDVDSFQMSSDIKSEHRKYWNEQTIADFWIGNSFHAPDDGQRLAYSLAEVLVRNIIANHRRKFQDFLFKANWNDAGESAAREVLGLGLGDCVAQFLGPGNWQPTFNFETTVTEAESKET